MSAKDLLNSSCDDSLCFDVWDYLSIGKPLENNGAGLIRADHVPLVTSKRCSRLDFHDNL